MDQLQRTKPRITRLLKPNTSGWSAAPHESVPSHVFAQAVHELHVDGEAGFRRDWGRLHVGRDETEADVPAGRADVKAAAAAATDYHLTRVPITSRLYRGKAHPEAYFVDGYQRVRAFIVMQRPVAATRDALWRLVWEQGVRIIVLMGPLQVRSMSDVPRFV
ncbi:tyrosine-protein phosphatase 99A-like [Pollicipes pollicipes]|uniref:tyrosine-protein phosphatase 99A-like n=1 Tax=Pollicipes pollicipes TaxID=41117 RepID=UPI001884A971|nr:tyrosine-protein phosphatase 99A-like [Pollicipes pollicipes]